MAYRPIAVSIVAITAMASLVAGGLRLLPWLKSRSPAAGVMAKHRSSQNRFTQKPNGDRLTTQHIFRAQILCSRTCTPDATPAMVALQDFYNPATGLWNTTSWWNAANALEITIDYSLLTGTPAYRSTIANTFEKPRNKNFEDFLNPWFYDDEGWWALTWIKAYDLTGETRYLHRAKTIFNDMKQGWDATCGGGVWWHKQRRYKDAITNELFLVVAARLHLHTTADQGSGSYLDWAQREWHWFEQSGMINDRHLINDGLDGDCHNNGQMLWTYNQGVILGGLVDLSKSTHDPTLLVQAEAIAATAIQTFAPNGILQEFCEPLDCKADSPQFKGIFIRNLSYLYQATRKPAYGEFIAQNANSIWLHRNSANQFGLSWAGPFDGTNAARQSSGMDAMNAALALELSQQSTKVR